MRRRIVNTLIFLYVFVSYSVGLVHITETSTFGEHNDRKHTQTEVAISWMTSPILLPCVYGERFVNWVMQKDQS